MIKGPSIGIRQLRNDEDEFVFQCLADWVDGDGPITRGRAIKRTEDAIQENQYAHYPLTATSDFFENFVIEHKGVPIGISQARIWGLKVWVNYISFLPEYRGRKLFEETYWAYTFLIFEVYEADRVWHEDFADVRALETMRSTHGGHTFETKRKRDRMVPRETEKWMFTREMFDAWPTKYATGDGRNLEFVVDEIDKTIQNNACKQRHAVDYSREQQAAALNPSLVPVDRTPHTLKILKGKK